jgi:hypothetical protein
MLPIQEMQAFYVMVTANGLPLLFFLFGHFFVISKLLHHLLADSISPLQCNPSFEQKSIKIFQLSDGCGQINRAMLRKNS